MGNDPDEVLVLDDVHAGYGEIKILRGVSVGFAAGTITAIIGANGAGKSTLLKTIFGFVRNTAGTILYRGVDISKRPTIERLKSGISIVMQGRCNFPMMTVAENLQMGAYTRRDRDVGRDIEEIMDMFEVLRRKRNVVAGNMSGGEQQILEMSMALLVKPSVILLDEPSLGLSPKMLDQVFAAIRSLADEKHMTVIMVEQNAVQALKVSDRGIVLELGRISHQGSGPQMLDNPQVRQSYLGLKQ